MSEAAAIAAAPFTGGSSLLGSNPLMKVATNALRAPEPPRSPAPVTTGTKAVQDAAADAAQRRSRARGVSSTILRSFLQGSGTTEGLKPTLGR